MFCKKSAFYFLTHNMHALILVWGCSVTIVLALCKLTKTTNTQNIHFTLICLYAVFFSCIAHLHSCMTFFPFEVFTSTVCLSHKRHKCCALQVASMLCWGLSKVTQIYQQWNFTSGFTNTREAFVWPHVHVSLFEVAVNWKVHAKAAGSL